MASARGRLAALFRKPFGWLHLAWGIAVAEGANAVGRGELRPSLGLAAIVASHATAFVALLLRRAAARFLIAAVMTGWAVALALQLDDAGIARSQKAIAAAVVTGLLGVAAYVLRAARIRSALG